MRVMVLVKATADSEAGIMPSLDLLTAMGEFNMELAKAGILLAGEGLHPSAKGKRVAFDGASRTVSDGPFAATGELVAGFWLWQVKDMEEALDWGEALSQPDARPERDRDPAALRDVRFRGRCGGMRGTTLRPHHSRPPRDTPTWAPDRVPPGLHPSGEEARETNGTHALKSVSQALATHGFVDVVATCPAVAQRHRMAYEGRPSQDVTRPAFSRSRGTPRPHFP